MKKIFIAIVSILATGAFFKADACTAVVVSGKYNASGRTLMIKVRDSDNISDYKYFHGPKYDFVGQTASVNTPIEKIRGSVSGQNTAGLCLASLTPGKGFPADTVKKGRVSGGKLIFKALGRCANLEEFEAYVTEIMKTRICVTHIAAIDAEGHGATYEMIGKKFVKYDVDDPVAAPGGFRCMTNFTFAGDPTLGHGQIRYDSAVEIMNSLPRNAEGKFDLDPVSLMDAVTRTFCHVELGYHSLADIKGEYECGDDFITRDRTNTIAIFESALPSEDASKVTMWTNLACPVTTPAVPIVVASGFIPEYLTGDMTQAEMVSVSMAVRDRDIYDGDYNKPGKYFNVAATARWIKKIRGVEDYVKSICCPVLSDWRAGRISDESFFATLRTQAPLYFSKYLEAIAE